MNKKSLYWFRRDLRLDDNRALSTCLDASEAVLPIFIFDTHILKHLKKDDQRVAFIYQALENLQKELKKRGAKLYVFYGTPEEIIPKLCEEQKIEAIYTAKAHSEYGRKRDEEIENYCFKNFIDFQAIEDTLIVPIEKIPVRKVFSAFYRIWKAAPKMQVLPAAEKIQGLESTLPNNMNQFPFIKEMTHKISVDDWKQVLKSFDWKHYSDTRDFPFLEHGTTKLSYFLRFGIISPRRFLECVEKQQLENDQLEKEIAWKEFWYHIAHHFPESLHEEFQEKRKGIEWQKNNAYFQAWCEGKTGYPIVDAAMKQLNSEGFMHGRCRMIVASFLTKDLLIDWRLGEQYFAEKLMDYDEAVNIGNWQWSASVGADPRPMRIFSPIRQSELFDPDATYIKKYLPELEDIAAEKIHDPLNNKLPYITPIVDHKVQVERAKEMYYKNISKDKTQD